MTDSWCSRSRCPRRRRPLAWLVALASLGVMQPLASWALVAPDTRPARAPGIASSPVLDPVGLPVCAAAGDQTGPRVVPAADGGAIVVWLDRRRGGSLTDLYALGVAADGSVTPGWPDDGRPLCQSGTADAPYAVPDGEGGALVFWRDRVGTRSVCVQRVSADGTLATGWPDDGRTVIADPDYIVVSLLDIHADGAGGAYVATIQDNWPGGLGLGLPTRVTRVTSEGTIASGWSEYGVNLGPLIFDAYSESGSFADDGDSGVLFNLQWRRWPAYYSERYYCADVFRISSTGVVLWSRSLPGHVLDSEGVHESAAATDGAGGFFASWVDVVHYPAESTSQYGQHFAPDGSPLWATTTPFPTCQYVEADGVGGAYFFGSQFGTPGLEVHRRLPDGSLPSGWTPAGVEVTQPVAMLGVARARLEAGLFLCWSEDRSGAGYDIRALGIDSGGTVAYGWSTDGTIVSDAAGNQVFPTIAQMSPGRYLACWQDLRTGSWDIRATRIDLPVNPVDVDPPPVRAASLSLAAPWPNPAGGRLTLAFAAPDGGAVALDIVDLGGRLVQRLGHWSGEVPRRTLEIDTARLAAGIYWVRLSQAGRSVARRIAVLR